jgi:hypothetical protein
MTQKTNPYIMNIYKNQILITFQHIVHNGILKITNKNTQKKELMTCLIENTNFVSLNISDFSGEYLLKINADGNLIQKNLHL